MHTSGKNLLLINPWIYDFTAYDLWSQPLGLFYIASFLRNYNFNIAYIDCLRSGDLSIEKRPGKDGRGNYRREIVEKPAILADIPRKYARYGISESEFIHNLNQIPKPDAILVTSIMTYWYPGPKRVVELLKQEYPDIPVILGGIYATLLPDHAYKVVKPDYVVRGPAEYKILELLSELLKMDIEIGILNNLDDFPYPAFDLITDLRYLCLMTARGCPFDCSFCAQRLITAGFSQRDPDEVVKEVITHYNKYKIRDFAFYDDALFVNKEKHIKQIFKRMIESPISVRFHTPNGLFVKDIDDELASLMFRANVKTVRLSFETSNESRRKDMNNKISNRGMQEAVHNLVKAGYKSHDLEAYVIMGLPGQTLEEILDSMIFVNNLGVQVRLASFSPIPGTRDFKRAVDAGLIPADIDPLLTNKAIFPLRNEKISYDTFRKVRIFSQLLNDAAKKELAPFDYNSIGKSLRKILDDN